jgi:hypothetical protein
MTLLRQTPNVRRALLALLAAGGLAACNEPIVPNHNALTSIPTSFAGVQNAIFGAFDPRPDVGNYLVWMAAMGRDATYFTNSEQRFVTELTGEAPIQPDDFIGGTVWDALFATIKTQDTVQSYLPIVANAGTPLTQPQIEAMWGAIETQKAATYMLIAETRDTNGVAINEVGMPVPSSNLAPILCNPSVWAQIVAMLDSAYDSLGVAGASTAFPFTFPPGFASVSGSAGAWQSYTAAMRGKARIEYAFSANRGSGLIPSAIPGTPITEQLDSAVTDITVNAPLIYSASLSPAEAVPANDAGVFYSFSPEANDVLNPVFNFIKGYYAIQGFVNSIDTTDARFTAKFTDAGSQPATADDSISSTWNYTNIAGASPVPVVRNLELQFLLAQAQIGLGQYAAAIATVNAVRTTVGGLPAGAPAATYNGALAFFLNEEDVSLIADGTGDRIISIRDFGQQGSLDTWGSADLHTTVLPIPTTESQPRAGNIACQNSSGLAAPRATAVKKVTVTKH